MLGGMALADIWDNMAVRLMLRPTIVMGQKFKEGKLEELTLAPSFLTSNSYPMIKTIDGQCSPSDHLIAALPCVTIDRRATTTKRGNFRMK